MTNDLRLIHTQGLDEGIRCAMCTNTMKSDKGCDGGCVVDQKMYEKVLKVIDKAFETQPTDAVRLISLDDIMAHFPKANFNGDPIENKKAYPYWKTDITGLISILKSVPMVNPCEDAVSRKRVIILIDEASEIHPYKVVGDSNTYSNYNQGWTDACDWLYANIDGIPSVKSQASEEDIHREREQAYMLGYEDASKKFRTEPCEDCISRQKALACFEQTNTRQGAKYAIETLSSVTPQRPKGKWIRVVDKAGHWVWECDCKWQQRFATNFCPNCGAEMSGGGEDGNI